MAHCPKLRAAVLAILELHAEPEDHDGDEFNLDLTEADADRKLASGEGYRGLTLTKLNPDRDELYPTVQVLDFGRHPTDYQRAVITGGYMVFEVTPDGWMPKHMTFCDAAQKKVMAHHHLLLGVKTDEHRERLSGLMDGIQQKIKEVCRLDSIRFDPNGDEVADPAAVRMMHEFAERWADRLWEQWLGQGVERIVRQV